MIVYKYSNIDENISTNLEINYCEDGLYFQIDNGDEDYEFKNIIIPHNEIELLIKYLQTYGKGTSIF